MSATSTTGKRKRPLRIRLRSIVQDMVKKGIHLDEAQDQLEREFLLEVMDACGGNQCKASSRLDMHRNTLRRKLQRHDLI